MPTNSMSQVVQHLRGLLQPDEAELTDGQLLECFVSRREPAALEALVRRHGPMVWGVCRRALHNHHDAEDAFQAAFLVLVRKATSIRTNVGSWLYGVAHQTARKAMATRAKRRGREGPLTDMLEPAAPEQDPWEDLQSLLDQELGRLPEKYRAVMVLCDLEGKSRQAAARELRCPEGTVASRLARGHAMLAKRLARHGVAISCGVLALALSRQAASACVPPSVTSSAIKAVILMAGGHEAATGAISVTVAALTEGVIKTMLLNKVMKLMAVLLLVAALSGTAGLAYRTGAAEPPQADNGPKAPKAEGTAEARAIIARAMEAQGGETNLARQKIVRQKGTYRRFIDATEGKALVSWEQITQQPDRLKNVQKGEIDGRKVSMTVVLKGDRGWASMDGQVEEMDEKAIAGLKEELYADAVSSLLPLRGKDYRLSVLAETKVGGRPAVGVKVAAKGHPDVDLYFDKESGLLVKRERRVDDGAGGQVTQEEFFSDYKETDRVKLPRKLVTYADGKKIAEASITEVQILDKVEDKEFDRPAPADTPKPEKQGGPPPGTASKTGPEDRREAPERPEDLKWRPARVAGPPGRYLVLVDPGTKDEFLPAAEAMAALHGAEIKRFDPAKLDRTLAEVRKAPPRFVVFVLPPEKVDVDLSHAILEMATRVDDDPFVDFEYGFVTGRDGAAALRFVRAIEQAWKRDAGDRAMLFGSWEGPFLPSGSRMTAMKALGFTAKDRYVRAKDAEETRLQAARQILGECKGNDALIFMSHGYPDRMDLCFRAKDLREWRVDLSPAILFNCACFNGAPGRWFEPNGKGYTDRGIVARDDSVALALLDSGIAGYFAGVDRWHGPLSSQVFYHVTDDGMRLGEAANTMFNRLALEFLPDRLHFEPTLERKRGGKNGWVQNQRDNGAGMILYGDPALAPFARRARHLLSARAESTGKDRLGVKIEVRPLVDGLPGEDFWVLPVNRLFDYYSLRADPEKSSPQLELYRVVPLQPGSEAPPALRVVAARSGDKDIPTGTVQQAVEDTPAGKLLHVRVPVRISLFGENLRLTGLARQGLTVELEGPTKSTR
jgi:RNA polymerase sigma factor (sigma-70 family)